MILAVVGSTAFAHPDAVQLARELILHKYEIYEPQLVVSGGAEGIDSLAEFLAKGMEIPFRPHLPRNRRWAPDGYMERNMLIAQDCSHLFAIRCHRSRTYGSGWTADYAEELGKNVERITL